MHLEEIPPLFILAITVCVAPYGAIALVTEGNDRAVLKPSVAAVSVLQGTNKLGLGESLASECPPGDRWCGDTEVCCPNNFKCCPKGRFPDRSLNSRSVIHILV